MIQEINGLTKIGENEIPFSFDKQKELIKLYTSSKPVTISDEVDTIQYDVCNIYYQFLYLYMDG